MDVDSVAVGSIQGNDVALCECISPGRPGVRCGAWVCKVVHNFGC